METTFSMFTAPENRTLQRSIPLSDPPKAPVSLTDKYRPARLAEIVGQGYAVHRLENFLDCPHSASFVFSGDTGTGKTSTALALANELNVNKDWSLHVIKSGDMDQQSVEAALKMLRFAGVGSPWKVVLCDEADSMSGKAKQLWLSALEDLPPYSIVIFTTNHLDRFEQRFLDRCEHIAFESAASTVLQDAQALLAKVWTAEGMPGTPPAVESLPGVITGDTISFRRVVRAVESESRKVKRAVISNPMRSVGGLVITPETVSRTKPEVSKPVNRIPVHAYNAYIRSSPTTSKATAYTYVASSHEQARLKAETLAKGMGPGAVVRLVVRADRDRFGKQCGPIAGKIGK